MRVLVIIIGITLLISLGIALVSGEGGFKRMVTISGIYSVCRPDNYDVVCFLDADGRDGGLFCVPLSQAGGKCKGE